MKIFPSCQSDQFKKVALALSALLIAGCSTTPISAPIVTGSKIVITRDKGLYGSGCPAQIKIDGKGVGVLEDGKYIVQPVNSGLHKVSAGIGSYAPGMFSGIMCSDVVMTQQVEVKAEPVLLRFGITSNSQILFEQADYQ